MDKKTNKILNKLLSSTKNTYEDKVAILRLITKKDSKNISSLVSSVIKKK